MEKGEFVGESGCLKTGFFPACGRMRIGLFGLGTIGSIWARLWRADGFEVRSWNRTPRCAEPTFCAEVREVSRASDLVAICVSDGAAVLSVLERIAEDLRPGVIVAQHSTLSVADTLRVREFVMGHGAVFLDMPFSGSKLAAEDRKVVFYAAGDARVVDYVTPVYRHLARKVLYVGEPPLATALKLSMNVMIAGVYQSLVEGLELALCSGVAEESFWEALDLNVAKSGVSELKREKIRKGDYSPHFSLANMWKDLRQALEAAREKGLQLQQTEQLERTYRVAMERGLGDYDFSVVLELLRSGLQKGRIASNVCDYRKHF